MVLVVVVMWRVDETRKESRLMIVCVQPRLVVVIAPYGCWLHFFFFRVCFLSFLTDIFSFLPFPSILSFRCRVNDPANAPPPPSANITSIYILFHRYHPTPRSAFELLAPAHCPPRLWHSYTYCTPTHTRSTSTSISILIPIPTTYKHHHHAILSSTRRTSVMLCYATVIRAQFFHVSLCPIDIILSILLAFVINLSMQLQFSCVYDLPIIIFCGTSNTFFFFFASCVRFFFFESWEWGWDAVFLLEMQCRVSASKIYLKM